MCAQRTPAIDCAQFLVFQGQVEQGVGAALAHGGLAAAQMLHPVPESPLAVAGFGGLSAVSDHGVSSSIGHHHPPKSHYAGNGKPKFSLMAAFFSVTPKLTANPAIASRAILSWLPNATHAN